jgi:SnoaL-like protein
LFKDQHNVFNPRITVDENRAHGIWYMMGPFTFRHGGMCWLACRYEDDYVNVNGDWKFQHLRIILRVNAPYTEGWSKIPLAHLSLDFK